MCRAAVHESLQPKPTYTRLVLFACIRCMVPAHSGILYDFDHMNEKFKHPRNRFDLPEWAEAFGVALIAAGSIYRTPFPVQPMKAIGAAAFAIWNVGVAVLFGILVHQGARRGWVRI